MELLNFFSIDNLYDLARGPMVWISFIVLVVGITYNTVRFLSITQKKDSITLNPLTISPSTDPNQFPGKGIQRLQNILKLTIFGVSPVTIVVSLIFHSLLFITPIFLLAHNILIDEAIGFSIFSFSENISNMFTIAFLLCIFFFLLRRIFLPRVRAISSLNDFLIILITAAPFVTGLFAYYQIFDYKIVIVIHMISGALMISIAPFSKISHMIFFFFGRFVLTNEYTMGKGRRTWQG